MNRLAFGAGLLVLAPVLSGCSNFYLTTPPPPEPTATPAPTPITYPFDPAEGSDVSDTVAIRLSGTAPLPAAFRVSDVQDIKFGLGRATDPANATLLLTLQQLNSTTPVVVPATGSAPAASSPVAAAVPGAEPAPDAISSAAAPAPAVAGTLIPGTKERNPYRLAGIIVPGPAGRVGAGLQDEDEQALLAIAHTRMVETVAHWVHIAGNIDPNATPTARPVPGATPTPLPRAVVRPTPISTALVDPMQELQVYQDRKFPVDSENRPLVQVMFKSAGGPGLAAGTVLSLNRMLVRSGWAVVDLYSPTSFDQKTWLLDEAYARHRRLGLWGLELNGKKLVLQQRIPANSTGTGALSNVPVTNGVPSATGVPIRPTTPTTIRTTVPPIPRVVKGSGTSVSRGPERGAKLPGPSAGVAAPAGSAPTTSLDPTMSNAARP